MTRIDFHTNISDIPDYICRLARKAYNARLNVLILVSDAATMGQLDDALWQFSDTDFLPHAISGSAEANRSPIVLTFEQEYEGAQHDLMVNVSQVVPALFARYQRLIEIVGQHDADVSLGRDRYRHYHQRGYALTHHTAGAS